MRSWSWTGWWAPFAPVACCCCARPTATPRLASWTGGRSVSWHAVKPGQPGPFAAVYEPIASARGIHAFLLRHGLVVAHRQSRNSAAGGPLVVLAAHRLVALLSLGRLACGHDELHYVVRKPEDPFARVLP